MSSARNEIIRKNRLMDMLADVDTKIKTLVLFFVLSILSAGVNLVLLYHYPSKQIIPFAALLLVFMIVIQFPLCGWLSFSGPLSQVILEGIGETMYKKILEKQVKSSCNSGRVYFPSGWVGCRVKIVRID